MFMYDNTSSMARGLASPAKIVELKLPLFHRVANPNGAVTRTRK
jgi:hypothetical protein